MRTTVSWMITVAAARSPPAASVACVPSISTSQRCARADQRKVNGDTLARPLGIRVILDVASGLPLVSGYQIP